MPPNLSRLLPQLATLPEERGVTDKISRKIASGDQEMIVWWSMKAGAHATAHKHPHEQIAWILKGKMEFRLGNERRTCGPGDVVVIPGGSSNTRRSFPRTPK